ncbi:hypothetical protein EON77_05880, partial [bacterium]
MSRKIVGGVVAAGAVLVLSGAFAGQAPQQPGAKGDVAGHVPAQAEQARAAPVRPSSSPRQFDWWSPGEGRRLGDFATYRNDAGELGVLLDGGALETRGHAFFEPLGSNGRACVTCHQPENAMSISVAS